MTFDNTPPEVREAERQLLFGQSWLERKRAENRKALEELERNAEWARDYFDKLDTLDAELVEDYARGIAAAAIEYVDARQAYQAAIDELQRAQSALNQARARNRLT
jgi:hypothetical protein